MLMSANRRGMMSEPLDERSWAVLNATVTGYIRMAVPVGSRAVNRLFGLSYSPATIRNVMADLEEYGYLTHPHTSAGRIPTSKGFRYFVDNSTFSKWLDTPDSPQLTSFLDVILAETSPADLLEVLSSVMSLVTRLTNYTGIVMESGTRNEERLLSFEIIPISERHLLAVLITETGTVVKRTLLIPEGVRLREIVALGEELNATSRNTSLSSIRELLFNEMAHLGKTYAEIFRHFFSHSRTPEMRLFRTSNFAEMPEFSNASVFREIMEVFEEKAALFGIFEELVQERGISVQIGSENPLPGLQPCTLISLPLMYRDIWIGSVGLVGPIRMQYGQVIPLMMYLSGRLNQWIEETLSPISPSVP